MKIHPVALYSTDCWLAIKSAEHPLHTCHGYEHAPLVIKHFPSWSHQQSFRGYDGPVGPWFLGGRVGTRTTQLGWHAAPPPKCLESPGAKNNAVPALFALGEVVNQTGSHLPERISCEGPAMMTSYRSPPIGNSSHACLICGRREWSRRRHRDGWWGCLWGGSPISPH